MREWIRRAARKACEFGTVEGLVGKQFKWDDDADTHPKYEVLTDLLNYEAEWKLQSLGSIKGNFIIAEIDCCSKNKHAYVHVDLWNSFRAGSMARIPGWVPLIGKTELLADSEPGSTILFNTVEVEWSWQETVNF